MAEYLFTVYYGIDIGRFVKVDVTDSDLTPSVANASTVKLPSSTGNYEITDFDDGEDGQKITVYGGGGTGPYVVKHDGSNIYLAGGIDFVSTGNATLELVYDNGTWRETGRVT